MPVSQEFCQNLSSDNKEKVFTQRKKFPITISFQKHKSMKSVRERFILAVRTAKYGQLREPIRMLLYTMDHLGHTIKTCVVAINNDNWTAWSTIQGVIGRVISNRPRATRSADLKLLARLPLNCTTRSPVTN